MHFSRQPASHRTPGSPGLSQKITSRPNLGLTMAIALALTLGCTTPSPSTQAETVSQDSAHTNSSTVATEPNPLPQPGNSDSYKNLENNLQKNSENNPDNQNTLAQDVEVNEVEMMRREALETAIAEKNFTPLISYCRMGECTNSYYTFDFLEREARGEKLYQAELLIYRSVIGESTAGEWVTQKAPTQVLCSTERPMTIDFDGNEYIVNHLSPGNKPPSFQAESDALYWAICHDTTGADLDRGKFREQQAIQLGYDLNREADQTRQDFIELIED